MLKKYFSLIISVLCVVAMLLNSQCRSCDDPSNPDCPNYDPCYGKTPTSADFKIMEEGDDFYNKYTFAYETDTVIGEEVTFEPRKIIAGAEYRWEIGAGTYDKPKVTLSFGSVRDSTTIPIKLVVKRNDVDKTCFPNDKGIDSLTKNMFVNRRCLIAYAPVIRMDTTIYRGYHRENPNEIIDVKFYNSGQFRKLMVANLVKEYNSPFMVADISARYRMIGFRNPIINGCAFLNRNDSIFIKYEYEYVTSPTSFSDIFKKEFIGKKIR